MNKIDSVPPIYQDSNLITPLSPHPENEILVKHYRPKPFTTKMAKYSLLRLLKQPVPVEYWPCALRRDFEKECLALWFSKGFNVPQLRALPNDLDASSPVLGMSRIRGERLDAYLANPNIPRSVKLQTIAHIYAEMHQRHCTAIFEQDHRLIHYDANLRNVLISDQQPIHIDFEMGHLYEDIDTSAAREVKKITLQLLNQLGSSLSPDVIGVLMANYRITHIVRKMIDEEVKRPFLKWHMVRDRQKKKSHTGLITKMDLAAALTQKLASIGLHATADPQNQVLAQAIETSWNGKYYQSLDDSDPRGRDMNHRYAVMGFPLAFDHCSVLDIGCNIGRICVDAKKRGATRAIGLDFRQDVVDAMNAYFKQNNMDVTLFAFDINTGVNALEALIGAEPFDYVCVLSIWSHVDKQPLWDIINRFCARVCFFEDNSPSRVRSLPKIKSTLEENLAFSKIEFMGFSTDRGVRAVFRMEK